MRSYFPPELTKKQIKEYKKDTLRYYNCDEEAIHVGVTKKKHDKRKSWKEYYTILFCDHLIFYKPGDFKDKIPKPPGEPVEWINLQYCTDYTKIVKSKTWDGDIFEIPGNKVTWCIDVIDPDTFESWLNDVKTVCQTLEKHKPTEIGTKDSLLAGQKSVEAVFPRKGFELPKTVPAKEAPAFITRMKTLYDAKKKWEPWLTTARLYIEFYQNDFKEYCQFYFDDEVGVGKKMKMCEMNVLKHWKEQPDVTKYKVEECLKAPQILKGDVREKTQMITSGLTYIKAVNDYRKTIFGISKPDPELQPKIKELAALAGRVKTHPIYNPDG